MNQNIMKIISVKQIHRKFTIIELLNQLKISVYQWFYDRYH